MAIRQDVAAVLKRPVSNTASFAQILEDTSRDTGNTQRIMRDLVAVCLTRLEAMEPVLEKGRYFVSSDSGVRVPQEDIEEVTTRYDKTNISAALPGWDESQLEETTAKYEARPKFKRPKAAL